MKSCVISFSLIAMCCLQASNLVARSITTQTANISEASVDMLRLPLLSRLITMGMKSELYRIMPTLIDYLDDVDNNGRAPLHWCVHCNDFESAENLLLFGANVDALDDKKSTPLHEAASRGHLNFVELFLDNGADPTLRDGFMERDAYLWAVIEENVDLVNLLLKKDSIEINGVDKQGHNAVTLTLLGKKSGKVERLRSVLEAGVDPNSGGALALIPKEDMGAIAELMLAHGADPNITNAKGGKSPLMLAVNASNVKAIEALLLYGANVNQLDSAKQNVLTHSDLSNKNLKEIISILLKHKIDLNKKGSKEFFQQMVKKNNLDISRILLEHVSNSDAQEKTDKLLASWFYTSNNTLNIAPSEEMTSLLEEYGADATKKAETSKTTSASGGETPRKDGKNKRSTSESDNAKRPVVSRNNTQQQQAKPPPSFLRDMNKLAYEGELPRTIGRVRETNNIIRALGRKMKSNPLLIGEAGVGKTAVVEGLAQRIVKGDVPTWMQDKTIYSLDVETLLAGGASLADIAGNFQTLLNFTDKRKDVIVFIDEIHRIVAPPMQLLADFLKQALARNGIQCIGATTNREYERYVMSDEALERRFLPIPIEAPSEKETLDILRNIKQDYENYHNIEITENALVAVVEYAQQYIPSRQFPDKAIDLLDEASAHHKTADKPNEDGMLVLGREHVATVVSKITNIPEETILQDKQEKLLGLASYLKERIYGQDKAIDEISNTLLTSFEGFGNRNRPLASILLQGATGVGKTDTARLISEHLFNANLIKIDMSQFSQEHTVAKLIGSPAGYVGYDDGGMLTREVRKKPYSVVLFDEIDKAHPNFINNLLQILDEGEILDNKGRKVSFKNTLIIFTSNNEISTPLASPARAKIGFAAPNYDTKEKPRNNKTKITNLPPEVLDRINRVVIFDKIDVSIVGKLIDKQLAELNEHLAKKQIKVELTETAKELIIENGYHPDLGVRSLQDVFSRLISQPLAIKIASGELAAGDYSLDLVLDDESGELTLVF